MAMTQTAFKTRLALNSGCSAVASRTQRAEMPLFQAFCVLLPWNSHEDSRYIYGLCDRALEEQKDFCACATTQEIAGQDYILTPRRYVDYVNYLDTSGITKGIISEIQHIPARGKTPSRARRKVLPSDIIYSTVRPNQHHYGIIAYPI